MNTDESDALLQAKRYIVNGNLTRAGNQLNALKKKFPMSADVARLWCSWAMRVNRTSEVPVYAKKIYSLAQNDVQKAHWAHLLATAYFFLLDLESSRDYFDRALNHLMAFACSGKAPAARVNRKKQDAGKNLFTSGYAEQLLWSTCTMLAQQDIPAFPFAGTLLGLEREGKLLDFDKDIDIAVWMNAFDACCRILEKNGWSPVPKRIVYRNYRDYVHDESGITLDVCGLEHRNDQLIAGGFSIPEYPAEYQRVSIFPAFELTQRKSALGEIWYPKRPEKILTAFYGDWRTPNPLWDTVISALNLEKFTLLVRCYAYHRLVKHWLSGDLVKAWSYAHQIALKDPDDLLALRSRQWLERIIIRTGQDMPVWPLNRPQRRIYTRMVADLFHVGHINFLKTARSLGTHLTVCVVPDQRVLENKGKLPVMKQSERVVAVAACKYVDAVLTDSPVNATVEFMRLHGFDIYTFACANDKERADKYQQCALLPVEMVRELDYTSGISTTEIVQRILGTSGAK
ncbi:MAG: adenylyltransferase/cytidyltransferase family protein [Burkholderiales bacterium]|nr:adenylyltransferase/cytidyltransferase family protein [Burkholderiales bacterium]MDR4517507.1 adenylyltransferase/cytidyltransferase family protein [Nitrosomonas sp.]